MAAADSPISPLDLSGRVFLVTGASSGIGREVAILLSKLNARAVLAGRDEERLHQTLCSLKGSGHQIAPFDLVNTAAIPDWVRSIAATAGPLDGVIHAAGISFTLPARYISAEKLDLTMRTNVYSAVMLARGFCHKSCHSSTASITFISSVTALAGNSGISVYACSKAALLGLTKSLAVELAPERIRVNCVLPGYVRSEMMAKVEDMLLPDQASSIERMHLLGLGAPSDVANAIVYLVSDAGRWVTGSTLVVDGGYTAH
jgi:NAD(P)-dependent dehydrogenase (short-subunit alcohol dehydrogenase family)